MASLEIQKRPVGAYQRTKTQVEQKIEQDVTKAASAKVATSTDPRLTASASLVNSVQSGDAVQVSADVLKLGGESLAKVAPSANNLVVTATAITSLNKATQGDTYAAASAAALAIEKASPQLANSAVAAVANVVVLGSADAKIAEQKQAVAQSAKRVMDANASPEQRLVATFDLTTALQGLVNFYRAAGNALWKVGTFALGKAGQVKALAPMAVKAQGGVAKLVASPLGKSVAFANKWMPLLNVAGVALAAKNAVDVFHDHKASTTSKALSIASVGTASAALVAGLTVGGWPFFATIAAGVAADVGLALARGADARGEDTDARARHLATHPGEAVRGLAGWSARAVPAFLGGVWDQAKAGWVKLASWVRPGAPDPALASRPLA